LNTAKLKCPFGCGHARHLRKTHHYVFLSLGEQRDLNAPQRSARKPG
jgi:hypothetical protein